MVSFPPASDQEEGDLAPVTYLPGVRPGSSGHGPPPDRYLANGFSEEPQEISSPEESSPDVSSPEERAQVISDAAMRALGRRGMSRWEVERLLAQRDFDAQEIETELDRLERVALLDDAALADTLVRIHHERKGLGRSAVSQELARRRIDPQIIAEAVSAIDDDDELRRATELAVKRAGQLTGLDAATAERRLTAYLSRRGYSSQIARQVARQALADRGTRSTVRFR